MPDTTATNTTPESAADVSQIMLQLLQENRDDVRKLLDGVADLRARVASLEANQGPQANIKRDAGLVAGAGTLVAGLLAVLQALGVVHMPISPTLPAVPPAISAPAAQ